MNNEQVKQLAIFKQVAFKAAIELHVADKINDDEIESTTNKFNELIKKDIPEMEAKAPYSGGKSWGNNSGGGGGGASPNKPISEKQKALVQKLITESKVSEDEKDLIRNTLDSMTSAEASAKIQYLMDANSPNGNG